MSYKQQHEQFVSGNNGTTVLHVAVTGICCFLPVYIRDATLTALPKHARQRLQESQWLSLVLDFVVVIVPLQLMMTVLGHKNMYCLFALTMLLWIVVNVKLRQEGMRNITESVKVGDIAMGNRRPFITYYRAYANIITAFSILAVDFKIFPRYFAKAETYGTGLMDVGVGGFMITNAIVSPEARGITSNDRMSTSILKSVKSSFPLIALGVVRVVSVKSLDYQEHVTEYGVHWNFFFTLAVVKVMCTVLFCVLSPRLWNVMGVLTIAFYQHSLTYEGLRDYILHGADRKGSRVGFIDSNREGVYSCLGFFSIYIMGVQLGKIVMRNRDKVSDWIKLVITLIFLSGACWVMLYFCELHVEPVSRRFANLAYLLWMLGFNTLLVLVFLLFDIAVTCLNHMSYLQHKQANPDEKPASVADNSYPMCDVIAAINYNGLFYFLLANLLTGCVNVAIKTIYQSNLVAMVILTGYMFVLSAVTYVMYKKKISLKFW